MQYVYVNIYNYTTGPIITFWLALKPSLNPDRIFKKQIVLESARIALSNDIDYNYRILNSIKCLQWQKMYPSWCKQMSISPLLLQYLSYGQKRRAILHNFILKAVSLNQSMPVLEVYSHFKIWVNFAFWWLRKLEFEWNYNLVLFILGSVG